MQIVDAHLDLSYNAVRGRPVHLAACQQTADEEGIPTVGLPDLRAGGVDLVCGTIFCSPEHEGNGGYRNGDEAHAAALNQLHWYQKQESARTIHLVRRWPADFSQRQTQTQAILLLEGADPIRDETDAKMFFDAGLRIVGLTWKDATRYAGGNAAPGPLTPAGLAMVKIFDQLGIIHDTSHLSDESFRQLLDHSPGPVMASHSNCRSIVPGERQVSDQTIRAIADRGGVIGINFFDRFLLPPDEQGKRRATLADVIRHVKHICDLTGSAAHVGLGTDMDGGLGREQIPVEIETSADLPRVAEALLAAGFADADVAAIMGENWMAFFSKNLGGERA